MSDEPQSKDAYGTVVGTTPAGTVLVENKSPSKAPVPKVIAAGVGGLFGGGFGEAFGEIVVAWLARLGLDMSDAEQAAYRVIAAAIVAALLAVIGGYVTPPQGFRRPKVTTITRGLIPFVFVLSLTGCAELGLASPMTASAASPAPPIEYATPRAADKARVVRACRGWVSLDAFLITRVPKMSQQELATYKKWASTLDNACLSDFPSEGSMTEAKLDNVENGLLELFVLQGRPS